MLKEAATERRTNPASGKLAMHYVCANCRKEFPLKQVQVDHKEPIGTLTTWDRFIARLYCEAKKLQVLCKPCHAVKTKLEREKAHG